VSKTEWNLVVACDMPGVSVDLLRPLVDQSAGSLRDCIIAVGPGGEPEPLCAVYHRRCLPIVARAIRYKRFKMKDLVSQLNVETKLADAADLRNVNTPLDWAEFDEKPR